MGSYPIYRSIIFFFLLIMNSTRILFFFFLFVGSVMSFSSSNWIGAWIGLEINIISFLPLIYRKLNFYSSESRIKYFIIQSMSSTILVVGIIIGSFDIFFFNSSLVIIISLLIKIGSAPFHMWVPGVMEGLNWFNCILVSTWQRVATLFLISYLEFDFIIILPILLCLLIGSIGGINQRSIKKIFGYSSIFNIGWILSSIIITNLYWFTYFFYYSFIISGLMLIIILKEVNYINQFFISGSSFVRKIFICIIIFSLGGLPPFLGFLPKWVVIQGIIFRGNFFTCVIIIFSSLITLFFYIRICSLIILINSVGLRISKIVFFEDYVVYLFSFFNMFGFIIRLFLKYL